MNRWVRSFVMWLLVLALPVQGFAASTMLLCGAGHHAAVQAEQAVHDHGSHHHGGSVAQAAPTDSRSAFSPPPTTHAEVKAKVAGKCSSCAACCMFAVLPASTLAFTAPAPSHVLTVVELTTQIGFFTDGPDRPPRLHLA